MSVIDYQTKLDRIAGQTLLTSLPAALADFVSEVAGEHRFTLQELRQVAEAARDLEMWCEQPLPAWWRQAERQARGAARARKKTLLRRLEAHLRSLASMEKIYPAAGLTPPPRRRVRLVEGSAGGNLLGRCPAFSERTVCCGLHTLDPVRGCPFSCSYCTIQTFYGERAELEADLERRLSEIAIDPDRRYHLGTGQASDSLVWGNRSGQLQAVLDFAGRHPNILLELKTKSDRVGELLARRVPANVVCSWSLNTPTVIRNEEHGTAPLARRLEAARAVADHGIPVAFHFHPMVYYLGWRDDYPALAARIQSLFTPGEVAFVSLGAVTLIKPVVREIRRRGGTSKILQMPMVPDPHGKLTYPEALKVRLFRRLYSCFRAWHREVFFYLCMETPAVWRRVLGRSFPDHRAFEREFLDRCLPAPGA